jgi:hypothetical protein
MHLKRSLLVGEGGSMEREKILLVKKETGREVQFDRYFQKFM